MVVRVDEDLVVDQKSRSAQATELAGRHHSSVTDVILFQKTGDTASAGAPGLPYTDIHTVSYTSSPSILRSLCHRCDRLQHSGRLRRKRAEALLLQVVQASVEAVVIEQFLVGSPFPDLAVMKHQNLVARPDGREPVRNDE